jgi:hypothetical protein
VNNVNDMSSKSDMVNVSGVNNMNPTASVMIACSMIRMEIEKSMKESGIDIPVVWMEKGLHEKPEKLREALQEKINEHQDKDVIYLGYCLCGNATLKLCSEKAIMILPKFDDCIRMLMSHTGNSSTLVDVRCLYFTKEWLDSEKFIVKDMLRYTEKYGAKKAARIKKQMLDNYTGLKLIDTGAYKVSSCLDEAEAAAEKLGLDFEIVKGTIRVLDKLFTGNHRSEICIIPPGVTVDEEHFSGRVL